MKSSIAAVILTYNEEFHIRRCLESLQGVVEHIYVMDSNSTDSTLSILAEYPNVTVKCNDFVNYASQFNHSLDVFDIESTWVMRIDADEYIDHKLARYLREDLKSIDSSISGILFNRYMTFMGKLLTHGGMSSYWMLRLWRNGTGRCEQTWMDEHIILSSGNTARASGRLIDDNLNTLSWWAHKHVNYSTREAIDIIQRGLNEQQYTIKSNLFGTAGERTRFLKGLYGKVPLFLRPFGYFIYRYFFRFGFLDGKQGFLWCFMQGLWYRMMVDAKILELKLLVNSQQDIKKVIKLKYGYEI